MNKLECIQAVEEMTIPAQKIHKWVSVIKRKYDFQPDPIGPTLGKIILFSQMSDAAERLIPLIHTTEEKIRTEKSRYGYRELFSHGLVGPILILEANSKMILTHSSFQKRPQEQTPLEMGQQLYLQKIHSAAEYLLALEGDIIVQLENNADK